MLSLFGLFVIVVVLANYCYADDKNCNVRELESKLLPLIGMFGSKEIKFAESEQEMNQWCRHLVKLVHFNRRISISEVSNLAKNYVRRCLNGLTKTLTLVTIYSIEKVYVKQTCKNKVERNNFISRAKCGNRGKKNTIKRWNNGIKKLSAIKNVTNAKIKIPLACCSFYEWKTCTIDVYRSIGSPVCSESAIEGYDQYITRGSSDPLNIVCSDYDDESDKCSEIKPLLNISRSNRLRYKTPVPGIIEIFNSL